MKCRSLIGEDSQWMNGFVAAAQVGLEVARRAKGLGMNVIAHDPYASEETARAVNVKLVPFEMAIETADFFSLHIPLTTSTKHMFNDTVFRRMKRGARIVNVARGGVIDDDALLAALDEGVSCTVHCHNSFD